MNLISLKSKISNTISHKSDYLDLSLKNAIKLLNLLPDNITEPIIKFGHLDTIILHWEKENNYIQICCNSQTYWYYIKNINQLGEIMPLNIVKLPEELLMQLINFKEK